MYQTFKKKYKTEYKQSKTLIIQEKKKNRIKSCLSRQTNCYSFKCQLYAVFVSLWMPAFTMAAFIIPSCPSLFYVSLISDFHI